MSSILLINPPLSPVSDSVRIPLNLIALGAALKKAGIRADIIDFDLMTKEGEIPLNENFVRNALEILKEQHHFTFLGITALATNYHVALSISDGMKRIFPKKKIILGGPQATATADLTLREFMSVDFIVRGEAENSTVKLIQSLENQPFISDNLELINGISFRKGGEIVHNQAVSLMQNLDDLPFPAFDLLDMGKYLTRDNPNIQIEAGRGCPFVCTFCSTNDMWKRRYRVKSPKRILHEMTYLYSHFGIKDFDLIHDIFALNKKFTRAFCEELSKNPVKFTWACSSRADNVDEETLKLMGESGCREIFYGIESGNVGRQKKIKKNLNLENSLKIVEAASICDLNPVCSFIIGFEEETDEELNQTLSYAIDCRIKGATVVQLPILQPHNGSPVFETLKEKLSYDSAIESSHAIYPGEKLADEMKKKNKFLFPYTLSFRSHEENVRLNAIRRIFASIIEAYPLTLRGYFTDTEKSPLQLFKEVLPYIPGSVFSEVDAVGIRNKIIDGFETYLDQLPKSDRFSDIYLYERTLQAYLGDDFPEVQLRSFHHPIQTIIAFYRGNTKNAPNPRLTYVLFRFEDDEVGLYEINDHYYENLKEFFPLEQTHAGFEKALASQTSIQKEKKYG